MYVWGENTPFVCRRTSKMSKCMRVCLCVSALIQKQNIKLKDTRADVGRPYDIRDKSVGAA